MEVAQIFLESFLSFLAIYFTGNVFAILFPKVQNPIQSVFFKIVIGILFWILTPAILGTSFKTIHLLLVPILFFFWKKKGRPFSEINFSELLPSSVELKFLAIALAAIATCIGFQFIRLDYFNPDFVYMSKTDFSFYITMAEYQFQSGMEGLTPWFEFHELSKTGAAAPYHFGDIWLTGSFLFWTKLPPLTTFLYVLLPTLMGIGFVGVLAFFDSIHKKKLTPIITVTCFLMLFSIGAIPFVRQAYGFHTLTLTFPKVFLFFLFSLLGFIFLIKKEYQLFVASFCLIPIFHILYAPLIFSAIFIWSGYHYFFKKEKEWGIGLVFPVLMSIGIIGFYLIFGKYDSYYDATSKIEIVDYLKGFFISSFRDVLARAIVFFAPILLLCFWIWRNRKKLAVQEISVLSFSIILFGATIFFRGLLNFNHESQQIPQLIFNPMMTILLIFAFSILVKNEFFNQKYKPYLLILLAVHLISSNFILLKKYTQRFDKVSFEFLEKMKNEMEGLPEIGVFISPTKDQDFHSISPHLCFVAEPLKLIEKKKWVNSISVPDDLTNFPFPERISGIQKSPFYKFIQLEKSKGTYTTYGAAQKKFVQQYKIGFVLIEKGGVISDELKSILAKTIEAEDGSFQLGIFKKAIFQ